MVIELTTEQYQHFVECCVAVELEHDLTHNPCCTWFNSYQTKKPYIYFFNDNSHNRNEWTFFDFIFLDGCFFFLFLSTFALQANKNIPIWLRMIDRKDKRSSEINVSESHVEEKQTIENGWWYSGVEICSSVSFSSKKKETNKRQN